MSKRVLVLGAGVAGLAAAFAARKKGHAVTVISQGAGASAFGGGAVDDVSWEERARAARILGKPVPIAALATDVVAFSEALGLWDLPDESSAPPFVATIAGRLRPCRGRDLGLLDVGALSRGRVLLPRAPRAAWDADALARTFSDEPFALKTSLTFEPIDADVLRFVEEARFPDGDLAARHDDSSRLGWLALRLREAIARASSLKSEPVVAVLVGSWLGAARARAAELSTLVGVPVGEALVGVGSAAGLRFEFGRRELLTRLQVEHIEARGVKLARSGASWALTQAGERKEAAPLLFDTAILATGGLVGGGIVYAPPEHEADDDMAPRGAVPYALSVDAPVVFRAGARHLDVVASMQGPELDTTLWPHGASPSALEQIGVVVPEAREGKTLFIAGDLAADRPRTLLSAVVSGLQAGSAS